MLRSMVFPLRMHAQRSMMNMPCNSLILTILMMKTGSFCWERIISSKRWLYATALERRKPLCV